MTDYGHYFSHPAHYHNYKNQSTLLFIYGKSV